MKCKASDCNNNVLCRELCNKHYLRWQRYKDLDYVSHIKNNDEKRFWSKVNKTTGCWIWTASTWGKGYGKFTIGSDKSVAAHRYAYMSVKGAIPGDKQLDHLCMNVKCVNPDHLEPVSNAENQYRAYEKRGAWPIETREPKNVICQYCNNEFSAIMYERAKYCSNSCKSKRAREVRAARLASV